MTLDDLRDGSIVVLTIEQTADLLGMRRTATYESVRRGEIPSLKLGRRRLVPVPALLRMLDGETPQAVQI